MPANADHAIRDHSGERLAAAAVLCALAAVAIGVVLAQARPNPALVERMGLEASIGDPAAPGGETILGDRLPEGLVAFSAPEVFDAATLSDKINGRAELYLTAGFVGMSSQRLAPADQPDAWFELYLYDMGTPVNAYAVYSQQRRADAEDLDWTTHAYATPDSFFVATGSEYAEIIASDTDERVIDAMRRTMQAWLGDAPQEEAAAARDRFPQSLFSNENQSFQLRDAFGCADLTEVFIVPAHEGGFFGFMSERASPEEADELLQIYLAFLALHGGQPVAEVPAPFHAVELYGMTEIAFSRGSVLAGIHDAEDRSAALRAAQALYEHLGEAP